MRFLRPRGRNGEISIPKSILHLLSEGKKRKRKTNEKMGAPVAGNLYWSRNTRSQILDIDESETKWLNPWRSSQ
jgi:hypothetical protein